MRTTIAALATAPGPAGIAVVRVSGPEAHTVARRVCPGLPDPARHRHLYLGRIVHPGDGRLVDEGLVVLFAAAGSFTGEPVAEVQGHGGAAQARALLEAVLAAGARPAGAGEFTRRAVRNGRLDLARAEGIAELVEAGSEAALRAARGLMSGALSERVAALLDGLQALAAEWEGALDFPEDVHIGAEGDWSGRVARLGVEARGLADTWERGRRLRDGARAVLVGPPNAGKSSLVNALAGFERVLVDPEPGTTRDQVEVRLELAEGMLTLVDGAGLRAAASGVEARGIERLLQAAREADLVVGVLDGSRPPGEAEATTLALLRRTPRAVVVLNKGDLGRSGGRALEGELPGVTPVIVSARTGEGLGALRRDLGRHLGGPALAEGEVVVTLRRHQLALVEAAEALALAEEALSAGVLDAAAEEVAAARRALAGILGRGALPEELLDRVFARFCIGK